MFSSDPVLFYFPSVIVEWPKVDVFTKADCSPVCLSSRMAFHKTSTVCVEMNERCVR